MDLKAPQRSGTAGVRTLVLMPVVAVLGILGAVGPIPPDSGPTPPILVEDTLSSLSSLPSLARDIRVSAVLDSYGTLIDSVAYLDDDVLFVAAEGSVYFQQGRMLGEEHLNQWEGFDPLFYAYSLRPLREPPPLTKTPTYSTDFLESLFGRTETRIRSHGVSAEFLDHKVFVNAFCLDALQQVEREIRAIAGRDPDVQEWVREIDVAYSFIDKEIRGSLSRSHHAFGLAIDLVPASYEGKQVYWRWSRVFNRTSWHRIPISERWSPPQAVVAAFERNGFVWGGKWSHFDTIHFEYRPEILAFNRMRGN